MQTIHWVHTGLCATISLETFCETKSQSIFNFSQIWTFLMAQAVCRFGCWGGAQRAVQSWSSQDISWPWQLRSSTFHVSSNYKTVLLMPLDKNDLKIIFRRRGSMCTTLDVACKVSSMSSRSLICQNHSFIYFLSKQYKHLYNLTYYPKAKLLLCTVWCPFKKLHLLLCDKMYLRDVSFTNNFCKAILNERAWSLKEVINLCHNLDFGYQKAWLNLPTS